MPKKPIIKRLYLDIETSPCLGWVWGTGKTRVDHKQILEPTKIICISYKWEHEKKVHHLKWDMNQCDKVMLEKFSKVYEEADVSVGHNSNAFDIKVIQGRLAYHKLPPMSLLLIEDTLRAARAAFRVPSFRLDYLGEYFKIGRKVETGGVDLWLKVWLDNDRKALKQMIKYCDGDVLLLEAVEQRIRPYIKLKSNLAVMSDDDRVCPSCGGKLNKHDKRFTTTLGYHQRMRCTSCGKVFKGKKLNGSTAGAPK